MRRTLPGVRVDLAPIADGGEGTARTLADATGGTLHRTVVSGPTGRPVAAHWARLGNPGRTAVVEMAAAAGLSLVATDLRDPGATTTYGVGQLIAAALDCGRRGDLGRLR